MNILVSWKKPSSNSEIKTLISELEKSHKIVYWIGYPNQKESVLLNNDIIFHSVFDAAQAKSAETINYQDWLPPSADLIKKFLRTESIILTMMNRKYAEMSVDQRRHLYYEMLGYWLKVLEISKPDVVIFNTIPHAVYNYILYSLCRFLNIKTVMFMKTWAPDRILIQAEISKCQILIDNFEKIIHNQAVNIELEHISVPLRQYYLKHRKLEKQAPNYMTSQFKQISKEKTFQYQIKKKFKTGLSSLRNGTFVKNLYMFLYRNFIFNPRKESYKRYQNLARQPDLSIPFIYVPLHYQPECTTSPQGGIFVDQILMLETLSSALPTGWKLYIKEAPTQWWFRGNTNPSRFLNSRYRSYYDRIHKIRSAVIIPHNFDTHELIDASRAVATVTGTAGFEALMRSKPALTFGYSWYQECPALMMVQDYQSVKQAFDKLLDGYKIDQQDVIDFLYTLDKLTLHAYTDDFGERFSNLSIDQNIVTVSNEIINYLNKLT